MVSTTKPFKAGRYSRPASGPKNKGPPIGHQKLPFYITELQNDHYSRHPHGDGQHLLPPVNGLGTRHNSLHVRSPEIPRLQSFAGQWATIFVLWREFGPLQLCSTKFTPKTHFKPSPKDGTRVFGPF